MSDTDQETEAYKARVGEIVEGYKLVSFLGHGGYGVTYLAEKEGVLVVLKQCHSGGSYEEQQRILQSLKLEAEFLKRLNHRALPRLDKFFPARDSAYMVLQYFEGKTFLALIKELMQNPGWNEQESHWNNVLDWARQMTAVLNYLHTFGPKPVVHKDIKPDNVMLRPNGRLALIDFGIARFYDEEKYRRQEGDTANINGRAIGTQGYAAPEYVEFGRSNPQCDLYSFGVLMFFWLTGTEPDEHGDVDLTKLASKNHKLWDGLASITRKAMFIEPSKRWKTAEEMAAALAELSDEVQDTAREQSQPCRVCSRPVLHGLQFCPSCGAATGSDSAPPVGVQVDVSFDQVHQSIVEEVLDSAQKPSALARFDLYRQFQELQKDPGFGVLMALPYLPRVEKLPHQIEVARKALGQMRGYCLLADEVGLGKTIEAGIILKELMFRDLAKKILIVASSHGMALQWQRELFEKFEVFLPVYGEDVSYSLGWSCDRIITQYRIVDDRAQLQALLASKKTWDLVILDEAHNLIAHDPRRGPALQDFARKLGGRTIYFLMLSATPVHNKGDELHALLSLLKPGSVGTKEEFIQQHVDPNDPLKLKNVPALRAKLESVMIRNTRRRIKELKFPRRDAYSVKVSIPPQDRILFQRFREFVRTQLWGVSQSVEDGGADQDIAMGFREAIQELVESFHSSPQAFARNCDEIAIRFSNRVKGDRRERLESFKRQMTYEVLQPKVEMVERTLSLNNGRGKFLIFTQYADTAEMLDVKLREAGLNVVLYPVIEYTRGGSEALAVLEQFEKPETQAMICSENAAEGLNLQYATRMINFDLPWDPMRLEQRIGRIQRLGQTSDWIYIYNLFIPGSVEEDILKILNEKIDLFQSAVGEVEEIIGGIMQEGGLESHFLEVFMSDQTSPSVSESLDKILDEKINAAKTERSKGELILNCLVDESEFVAPVDKPPARPDCSDLPSDFTPLRGSGEKTMYCMHCNSPLEPSWAFCEACGEPVTAPGLFSDTPTPRCAACDSELEPGVTFCEQCGTRVGGDPAQLDIPEEETRESLPVFSCANPNCSALIEVGSTVCPACGTAVAGFSQNTEVPHCAFCDAELGPTDRFCDQCGKEVLA